MDFIFVNFSLFGNFEVPVKKKKIIWKFATKLLWLSIWLLAIINHSIHYMEFLHSNDSLTEVVSQNGYVCKRLCWPINVSCIQLVKEKKWYRCLKKQSFLTSVILDDRRIKSKCRIKFWEVMEITWGKNQLPEYGCLMPFNLFSISRWMEEG